VFADDWGRHPSSCQHLVRHLLGRYEAVWVNTIGTRTPRLDWATLKRGLEKARHWTRPAGRSEPLPDNLRVVSPKMWPWLGSAFARRLNRGLLGRQLLPLVQSFAEPPVAVTTLPVVADLMGRLPVRHWVYYCVDDFGQWPGLDQATMQNLEEVVVARADTLLAVSETLRTRLAGMGRQARLLTHGVDLAFWSAAQQPGPEPERLHGLPRPLVVFWGLIDRRLDVALVRRLAADLAQGTIVLVGPEADPDPELLAVPRVVRTGSLPYDELPAVARAASVLVMPYADIPVTRAMQPLKLKEYLATGKPTVVTALPAVRSWADCMDLADSPEAFSEAVRRRLEWGLSDEQRRARARLAEEGWQAKARQFEQWALRPPAEDGVKKAEDGRVAAADGGPE
jgi:glycosyltransferase involved in cell wall biosynthesis